MVMVEVVKNSGVKYCTSNLALVVLVVVGEVVKEQVMVAGEMLIPAATMVTVLLVA